MNRRLMAGFAFVGCAAAAAWTSSTPRGMRTGPLAAHSLGQLAFGPNNVLFIGDNAGASVHALQLNDAAKPGAKVELTGIDTKLAQALGTTTQGMAIIDMAVHPASHNVYLTVRRGNGADMQFALMRVVAGTNAIEQVSLDNVKSSTASIANAPASNPSARQDPRNNTITDIAYADGKVWIAGLSNEEFSSSFRQIAYPFNDAIATTSLQIYHVSHRKSETQAPVMTFTPQKIGGKLYMLAGYTCTPLVTFDVTALKNGEKVVGRTVAELGAGNQPVDMIGFTQNGKDVVLVANRTHAMMKLNAADFVSGAPLTTPDVNGIPRTNVSDAGAIVQLADYDNDNVLVIQKANGGLDLKTVAKSSY